MKASFLYQKLEIDFELDKCNDDWRLIDPKEYISDSFKKRSMGLVLDNTDEVDKIYTAVFPSDSVLNDILSRKEKNVLLFTHHPMTWDTKTKGFPFLNIAEKYLERLRENKISLYTLHVPLDKNGPYSTSVNYAKAVGISHEKDFAKYYGVQAGILGKTDCASLEELFRKAESAVGHRIGVLSYGNPDIGGQTVAVVAGGGNDLDVMKELLENNIKIYLTGVIKPINNYPPSIEFDRLAKENKINVIGATHYSTEKFACMEMVKYFEALSLPAEFIPGAPDFGDIE